tara:strand:- start:51 stop:200 length:150 start_codon:yes stop_codon:yes gene_type:complete
MIGNGVGCVYKKPVRKETVVYYESEIETFIGFILCVAIGIGIIFLSHFI